MADGCLGMSFMGILMSLLFLFLLGIPFLNSKLLYGRTVLPVLMLPLMLIEVMHYKPIFVLDFGICILKRHIPIFA